MFRLGDILVDESLSCEVLVIAKEKAIKGFRILPLQLRVFNKKNSKLLDLRKYEFQSGYKRV